MTVRGDQLLELVQGTAAALTAELEEAMPLPWSDGMRAAAQQCVELGIREAVADVLDVFATAIRDARSDT